MTEEEAEAVAEIVKLCGPLPLAISLLAAHLAHHPTWDIATFAHEFATAQNRLGELGAGDRAVTAAFDLSYQAPSADQQNFFRRLGLHPGPEIDTYAAAAADDLPLPQARRRLNALYADHFIDEPAPGRYRMHDLVRESLDRRVEPDGTSVQHGLDAPGFDGADFGPSPTPRRRPPAPDAPHRP
ncbi:hypothetical protein ACFC1L_43360 [Streptomyces sp. NPDC056210]|uniref:hypothetical protein n=1 Tax=Streptomyces sp. NPDC056210 TaxID=3345746 RepID=UPI0035E1E160